MNKPVDTQDHVGELLSGFVDGELTQQQSQRVSLHVESCAECGAALQSIREMRDRVGAAVLSGIDRDAWRENMKDATVTATRGIGWLILIGAALVGVGAFLIAFLGDPGIGFREKMIFGGIYGGLLLLFISVLRQRLIERKTDKYKDVEI